MKKRILSALIALIPSATLLAGGLTTNTNQNAAYLRQLSQEAIIDITGLYMNPAGTAFLAPGYHFSLNIQSAKQDRDIETTFPLMQYSHKDPSATRLFHGEANAPIIPSFQFSYNWEKWSVNANFAIGGGGGKCEFDNGLDGHDPGSGYGTKSLPGLQRELLPQRSPISLLLHCGCHL